MYNMHKFHPPSPLLIVYLFAICIDLAVANNLDNEKNINPEKIEVTLISPEIELGINIDEILIEGLVNDLTVDEVKILINSQEVQFVPVIKGYFKRMANFSERDNLLTIYGTNSQKKIFRFEYQITNHSKRKKTVEEKVAPIVEVNYLDENNFNILSPVDFEDLTLEAYDNNNDIIQLAYILDNSPPVYLPSKNKRTKLGLRNNLIGRQSSTLIVYAIDGDGNKTQKRYHFRIENLRCNLSISPPYGIFENNSVIFKSTINGGKGNIQKLFMLDGSDGSQITHETMLSNSRISLASQKVHVDYRGTLQIKDENGITAKCTSPQKIHFYPRNHPINFQVVKGTKLQSIRQSIQISIEPPIIRGDVNILLKSQQTDSPSIGDNWKVLGRKKLNSEGLKRFWEINLTKKVPPGYYLMKLSLSTDTSDIIFSDKKRIEVIRSVDDTQDLLQEILRGEE